MFLTLFLKEMRESVLNSRYMLGLLLCLLLTPVAMYTAWKDYELRRQDWQEAMDLSRQGTKVSNMMGRFERKEWSILDPVEIFRPPSMLGFLASGLDLSMPNKAVTTYQQGLSLSSERGSNSNESILFGRIDQAFVVSYVLSVLALLFTYSGITAEKESGTLRQIGSNAVPRWAIYLAKLAGGLSVFLLLFCTSFLLGILILRFTCGIELSAPGVPTSIAVFFAVSALFLAVFFNLGLLVSTLTHSSVTAVFSAMLIWVLLVMGVPRVAPLVAEILYPVESSQTAAEARNEAINQISKDFEARKWSLYSNICASVGVDPHSHTGGNRPGSFTADQAAYQRYREECRPLESEYKMRVAQTLSILQRDYETRLNRQSQIATHLSRLSPVGCYVFAAATVARTGPAELENFRDQAVEYQETMKREIYDKITVETMSDGSGSSMSIQTPEGFKSEPPLFVYRTMPLVNALLRGWVDIFLLFAFNALFLCAGFSRFLRYDVR